MARCIIAGLLVTYALAVFQTTLGESLALSGVPPDLLFVWTATVGLLSGAHAGALAGFASGVLEGSLKQTWIGAFAISKALSGLAAGFLATKMFRENLLVPALAAAALTALNEGVFLLIARTAPWGDAGRIIGLRALYHALLAPFAFAAAARVRHALVGGPEKVL